MWRPPSPWATGDIGIGVSCSELIILKQPVLPRVRIKHADFAVVRTRPPHVAALLIKHVAGECAHRPAVAGNQDILAVMRLPLFHDVVQAGMRAADQGGDGLHGFRGRKDAGHRPEQEHRKPEMKIWAKLILPKVHLDQSGIDDDIFFRDIPDDDSCVDCTSERTGVDRVKGDIPDHLPCRFCLTEAGLVERLIRAALHQMFFVQLCLSMPGNPDFHPKPLPVLQRSLFLYNLYNKK